MSRESMPHNEVKCSDFAVTCTICAHSAVHMLSCERHCLTPVVIDRFTMVVGGGGGACRLLKGKGAMGQFRHVKRSCDVMG